MPRKWSKFDRHLDTSFVLENVLPTTATVAIDMCHGIKRDVVAHKIKYEVFITLYYMYHRSTSSGSSFGSLILVLFVTELCLGLTLAHARMCCQRLAEKNLYAPYSTIE